jgi:hypothetical protein
LPVKGRFAQPPAAVWHVRVAVTTSVVLTT